MSGITIFQRPDGRPPIVRDMLPGLTEVGRIKIGKKGDLVTSRDGKAFQPPKKQDYFTITTVQRDADNNFVRDDAIHAQIGPKPREIEVRLLFNDPWANFQSRYIAFDGKSAWCSGDGHEATRRNELRSTNRATHKVSCTCEHLDPKGKEPHCKINGRLSVLLDHGHTVGGVWTFRTTSWNSIRQIQDSLRLLAFATKGQLAGLPFVLTIKPKQVTMADGRVNTIQVVGIEYRGSFQDLRQEAERAAASDVKYGRRIRTLDAEAKLLTAPIDADDEDGDVISEFYPTAAVAAAERETGGKVTILDEAEAEDLREEAEAMDPGRVAEDLRGAPEDRQEDRQQGRGAPRDRQQERPQGGPRDRQQEQQEERREGGAARLAEVWDVYGEPRELPGIEVEAWLEDQLAGVASIEALNALVTANDEHWTAYLAEKAHALRARLLAAEAEAKPAPKKERERARKPKEPDAAPAGAADPAPAAGEGGGDEDKGPVTIRWPTDAEVSTYPKPSTFLAAYQRRRGFAGAGFEALFRRVGPDNEAAWRRCVPAADRNP